MRAANGVAAAKGGYVGSMGYSAPAQEMDDRTQCPHCQRKFSEMAAQRHIPHCELSMKKNAMRTGPPGGNRRR